MRALTEDTKKLSLTYNNKSRSLSSAKENRVIATAKTTATKSKSAASNKIPSVVTPKISESSVKVSKLNKSKNMQQQVSSSKTSTTKSVLHSSSTSTGASAKQQKQLIALKQQQQPAQQHALYNNNSHTISLPKASHANTSEELAGGVQDTIYLCNFRVSVDGEWLCLKELQDIDVGRQTTSSSGIATSDTSGQHGFRTGANGCSSGRQLFNHKNKRFSGLTPHGLEDNGILAIENLIERHLYDGGSNALAQNNVGLFAVSGEWSNLPRDSAEIERSNLVNICKLVVKELLEQSLRYGRMLDSDHLPLQHFFIVIEHVLGHGLRPKKGLLGPRKELWDLLQSVENYCPESQDITASVRDLPTVRTHIGRARAWLRIALMQKKLADYLQALIEHRDDALLDYYESHALMLSDEIVVIMGILVGLNVIDCNLCVKEEDLDSQQGVIDFSLYLRSSSRNNDANDENPILDGTGQGNMIAVLDQKNYIEELNRHLNATIANMQAKVESLTTTNALMKEDLAIARNSLLALQAENQAMLRQNSDSQFLQLPNVTQCDTNSTSASDKESLDSLTTELSKECKRNEELDKELKLQISLKAESDMAMKLLEKDIHEKQDTIVSLRRQLDDIKQINLEMYRKLQDCEASLKHKTDLLTKLESQKEDMARTIALLETKWSNDKSSLGEILKNTSQTLSTQVNASEERAARAEAESRIEREWRISLQEKESKLKDKIKTLQSCIKTLNDEKQEIEKLKYELEKVRRQWSEAQATLEELGIQLSVSKLKIAELQENEKRHQKPQSPSTLTLQGTQGLLNAPGIWTPDSIATNCTACRREFNLTRRKHHCRNCGEIFCNSCSEHTLSLLNDQGQQGKPVRVCNVCYENMNK